jgi:alpha-galactosidase
MIVKQENTFFLQTKHTSYILRILPEGLLEHLHYGRRIQPTVHTEAMWEKMFCQPGNTVNYPGTESLALEELPMELSGYGSGDIREPFLGITYEDGSSTSRFLYESSEIQKGKTPLATLPCSYGAQDEVTELRIRLTDPSRKGILLTLLYQVYEEQDVITKSVILENAGDQEIILNRLMSSQLDFQGEDYVFHTFGGPWTREMNHFRHSMNHGKVVNSSVAGVSSNRNNPFTMLSKAGTTEEAGACYGFHLVYSGNHYTCCEATATGRLRLTTGINPEHFQFRLQTGERFETPEAVMTFSPQGFRGMSRNLHGFIRQHIVRGSWQYKERPVLLNSWEAAYFDINESKLLKLARAGKEAGIELFVVDDGWFGKRKDDKSSLGDWVPDPKKLPGGLKGLAEKIHREGLQFGIWVEPEMASRDSDLYRAHSDWAIQVPGQPHAEGRNQMLLDFSRQEVREYVISAMEQVFSSADINYVKWDMNRIFSDYYSSALPADRQGELGHRYVMGLYQVMKTLTEEFPEILFEACASGGNRFDLGMLCYMPQIWASDNTDAYSRAGIQTELSYGYPQSVFGAHVSGCPNHQTLRNTSLETRFDVAAFGILGYECNISELSREDREQIKEQIAFYKKYRRLFQFGDFYRLKDGAFTEQEKGQYQWMVVSPDQSQAVGMYLQGLSVANARQGSFQAVGLKEEALYHFQNRRIRYDIREFGDLINTVAPIHVKKDSALHGLIAKFVKMDNEKEDYILPGDMLMYAGVRLAEAYTGVGYSEKVRLFKDFEARLYLMEEME